MTIDVLRDCVYKQNTLCSLATRNTESQATRNTESQATRNTESQATRNTESQATRNTESQATRNTESHASQDVRASKAFKSSKSTESTQTSEDLRALENVKTLVNSSQASQSSHEGRNECDKLSKVDHGCFDNYAGNRLTFQRSKQKPSNCQIRTSFTNLQYLTNSKSYENDHLTTTKTNNKLYQECCKKNTLREQCVNSNCSIVVSEPIAARNDLLLNVIGNNVEPSSHNLKHIKTLLPSDVSCYSELSNRSNDTTTTTTKTNKHCGRTLSHQRSSTRNNTLNTLTRLMVLILACTGNLFNTSQLRRVFVDLTTMTGASPGGGGQFGGDACTNNSSVICYDDAARHNGSCTDRNRMAYHGGATTVAYSRGGTSGMAMAAIIPPLWANSTVNPCARNSWQLIYWPKHDKCYKIFSQGPCSEGEEVYHEPSSSKPLCRCEKGRIKHGNKCYTAFARGPCKQREYLRQTPDGVVTCRKFGECAPGDMFWPPQDICYRQYTRGPCQHGDLLHLHPDTGWPTCGCDSSLMRMQFWTHTNSCHELLSRGPCVTGHVFHYNNSMRATECACDSSMTTNYHKDTQQCYPLDSKGPCPPGHVFSLPKGAIEPMCTCLKGHLLHVGSGTCQRAYTRAACPSGQFLRPDTNAGVGVGRCAVVPCKHSGQLYNPDTDKCYPVGSTGPCSKGKLWVYERASSLRGRCHCDKQLVGYWGPHDICYPLGEQGPCPARHIVTYSASRGLACSCDRRRGYSRWKGRCERITAADIIRDLLNSNLMDPHEEPHHVNSVMRSRSMNFDKLLGLTTTSTTIPSTTTTTTTTPRITTTTKKRPREQQQPAAHFSRAEHPEAPHISRAEHPEEIITFSRDLPNSIEETAATNTKQNRPPAFDDSDIRQRIARLTHRGLITRRTRRPSRLSR